MEYKDLKKISKEAVILCRSLEFASVMVLWINFNLNSIKSQFYTKNKRNIVDILNSINL